MKITERERKGSAAISRLQRRAGLTRWGGEGEGLEWLEERLTACACEDMEEAGERKGGCGSRRLEERSAQSAEQGVGGQAWRRGGGKRGQGRPSSSAGLA